MKKSFPAALVCAAALLIPSTAYACPTDCSTSGDDSATQLDVKDRASTQVDTEAAKKEVERARSFMDASADLSQEDLDCFLSKVLKGSYYDKDSRTVRTDDSARVGEDLASSQSSQDASRLARWLYEHEDTWQSITEDYEVGDLLSFSVEQSATSRSSSEFFASIKIVAVYVGDGRVIYCANDGSSTQIKEESIAVLEAELNLTVTLASRPCDVDNSSATPSAAPSESATNQSCQRTCQSENSTSSSESSTSNETSQDSSRSSSTNTSSESTETSSRSSNTSDDSNNVTNESSNSSSSESSDVSSTSSESTDTTSRSTSSSESSEVSSSESSTSSQSSSSTSESSSESSSSSTSSDTSNSETSTESSSDSSVVAPEQSSSTTAPSSNSSSPTKSSSAHPSSLPRTGAGAVLPVAGIAVIAAAAGGSILARRRSHV